MKTTELYMDFGNETKTVLVTSKNATQDFNLHPEDFNFIYQDIEDNGANQGQLQVIVDEGLIDIEWDVLRKGELYQRYAEYIVEQMTSTDAVNEIVFLIESLPQEIKEDLEETMRAVIA